MYISEVTLSNFKGFYGTKTIKLNENLTYVTGENNAGKSTIFSAISTLRDGKEEQLKKNTQCTNSDDVFVEIKLEDKDMKKFIDALSGSKKDVLKTYLFVNSSTNSEYLMLRKSTETFSFNKKNGVPSTTKPGDLVIKNPKTLLYENPTGIDASIKALFDVIWIEADHSSDDEVNFKSSGTIGKIIANLSASFSQSQEYQNFHTAHTTAFNKLNSTIAPKLNTGLDQILDQQYGRGISTKVNFHFPSPKDLISNASLLVDDGVETELDEKGHGLQRSVALALIQYQASLKPASPSSSTPVKQPIFYLIDEPEVYLHPMAQHSLRDSLQKLSLQSQVVLTTHSPYIFDQYNNKRDTLILLGKQLTGSNKIVSVTDITNNLSSNPTTAEISYVAYQIPTFEFFNQLFDKITVKSTKTKVKDVDNYIASNANITPSHSLYYQTSFGNTTYTTLPTAIRNTYHHSSSNTSQYTTEQLTACIDCLISLL